MGCARRREYIVMRCAWLLLASLALAAQARADAVADFYKGRTVTLIVGYGPGGGYDLFARLMARHLGRHIPGNPAVVVQNMPGAGSLRATNFLYTVAPRDGATIGSFARDMPLLAILKANTAAVFDPRKFTWLGSSSDYSRSRRRAGPAGRRLFSAGLRKARPAAMSRSCCGTRSGSI